MMYPGKKSIVFTCLFAFVMTGILASRPPGDDEPEYKNLKVLSYSLTDEKMDQIMHSFNSELGVTCIYCHIIDNKPSPPVADFATDILPEKKIAREMLKMTLRLNRKYFGSNLTGKIEGPVKIWCGTCHKGLPRPMLPPKKTGN